MSETIEPLVDTSRNPQRLKAYIISERQGGCICEWSTDGRSMDRTPNPNFECPRHENNVVVDSLDDMQPVPRAGKFFAERVLREEVKSEGGVILQEGDDPNFEFDVRTKRARVIQLGVPRDGEEWDFKEGWDVIVAYHAGHEFTWMNQARVKETLWIIDAQEPLAIFKPR